MLENMLSQNKKLASGVALIISVIFSVSSQIPNSFPDNQLVTTLPPLKQIKSGILARDVQCSQGLILVLKSENDSPACVKETSFAKLLSRGWAKQVSENMQMGTKIVTLEQNNQAISLKKGQSFLLKLGDSHDWSVDISNQTVVSRVMNVMVIRGAQGLYQAHNIGTTTLASTGDTVCYKETPRCLE